MTVEVSSSILLLPEKPMTGRFDNQKVGYFTNPLLSFSDAQQGTDKKQYITRWRMEPSMSTCILSVISLAIIAFLKPAFSKAVCQSSIPFFMYDRH